MIIGAHALGCRVSTAPALPSTPASASRPERSSRRPNTRRGTCHRSRIEAIGVTDPVERLRLRTADRARLFVHRDLLHKWPCTPACTPLTSEAEPCVPCLNKTKTRATVPRSARANFLTEVAKLTGRRTTRLVGMRARHLGMASAIPSLRP